MELMKKAFVGLVVAVLSGCSGGGGDTSSTETSPDWPSWEAGTSPSTEAPTTTIEAATGLAPSDLFIDFVILDESCFNTAGSSMTVELSPVLDLDSALEVEDLAGLKFRVLYEITNTDGGIERGSFTVDDGSYSVETRYLSFPSCNTLPSIDVTDVEML